MAGPRKSIRSRPWCAVASVTGALASFVLASPVRAANIFGNAGLTVVGFAVDPSVRSQAMGGASGAVFWGQNPNYWANPALLGFVEGIAYEDAARGTFASDSKARRLTLGYGGVGLATAGPPFSGLAQFESSLFLSVSGLGDFDVSEETQSWGMGLSVSRILSTVAGLRGQEPPAISRYADVVVGYNHKTDKFSTDPSLVVHTTGEDWGVLARGTLPMQLGSGDIPARIEAAYAYSVQNANDASFNQSSPVNRPHRHSLAARFALDHPASWRKRMPVWVAPGLDPLVSIGGAWDREFITAGDGPTFDDASHLGGELGFANVAFLRLGQDDNGHDWGYALALPLGAMGGFQYSESQRRFEDDSVQKSHAWLFWVSPVEIARTLRGARDH